VPQCPECREVDVSLKKRKGNRATFLCETCRCEFEQRRK
jgi:transcription elongation factor Elf1